MDELLREFLTETRESLDTVDVQLVRFEQDPNNSQIVGSIFRLVHTIKGTCGFIGLPRLEALAHAAETLIGKFRDGMPVTADAVTLILACIDRIKEILAALERTEQEPEGADCDIVAELERMSQAVLAPPAEPESVGSLVYQGLERPLRPGEASLDELERAFRETPMEVQPAAAVPAGELSSAPAERIERGAARRKDDEESAGKIAPSSSIRVHLDTLEHMMTMVSELVLTRNQLLEIVRRHEESEFKAPLQRLSHVTAELQGGVMKTRMQPIGNAWAKLPRIVRDLAAELGKEIDLQMLGADTELDRQVLDLVKDPLTHMVRNSADHGLETPAERRALGKSEKGVIRLSARHEGGYIIVEIADDGRGLNTEKIKSKAVASGLATEAEIDKMSEAQIHKFIFAPGLSTARTITSVSGRGVGMDVVKANIDRIGGSIDIKSTAGAGCSLLIKIPLTLAIISALIVEACGERFAIPQLAVVELVRIQGNSEHRIERIKDTPVLRLRDKLMPLVSLGALLGIQKAPRATDDGFVVVTQVGSQSFGIIVDGVFHTEEIVVKPISSKLRHIGIFSGNTILGDGSVIIIIDPNGLADALDCSPSNREQIGEPEGQEESEAADATSLLVFRAGSPQLKAVPLSLVTRIEEIDCRRIELSNGRHMVQYRGQLMPLARVNEGCSVRSDGAQPILVFSHANRSIGLAVDEIVDIVEDRLVIEVASTTPGVLGSAIVNGQTAEIIDVGYFLSLAFQDWFRRMETHGRTATPRILLVDDTAFFRDMLTPVLQAAGYHVVAAASAKEALTTLQKGAVFQAIVSDLDMPEIDGFELARTVHADARLTEIPTIALASHAAPGLAEKARAAGFRALVAKFDRPALLAALNGEEAERGQAA